MRAVYLARDLALGRRAAIKVAHNVEPENVIVTDSGTPKLLDFGLAKALRRDAHAEDVTVANLTGGRIIGTVGYMSSEQLRGDELGPASDLFARAAVL